jgi:hypothetical protein
LILQEYSIHVGVSSFLNKLDELVLVHPPDHFFNSEGAVLIVILKKSSFEKKNDG